MSSEPAPPGTAVSMLECPICMDLFEPGQIQQCGRGHMICSSHRRQLQRCPVCRDPYGPGVLRNLLAERLVQEERARKEREATTQSTRQQSTFNGGNGPRTTSVPLPYVNNNLVSCQFISDGCNFDGNQNSVLAHEPSCHFRSLICCLSTPKDECYNNTVRFFDYITHLTGVHGVKHYHGSHHVHNFVVKPDHKKMIRDGSSSLFILEVACQVFLVRGVENGENVYVWVAFHGHPDDGRVHSAGIEFNFQEDEIPTQVRNNYPGTSYFAIPNGVDFTSHPFSFSGNVLATTRLPWDQIAPTGNYFTMNKGDVEDFIKQGAVIGRHPAQQSWAINVTITRSQPQAGGWNQ